jgi:glycosyltransferase involved in cell wall biosynthesis
MILNQSFPDIRVKQEYDALIAGGYRVIIVTRDGQTQFDECYELLPIVVSKNELEAYINCLFVGNPWLTQRIVDGLFNIGVIHVDAVHVHDLFWAISGYDLSKKFSSKFVIDFHENYPAMIHHFNESSKKFGVKKTLRNKFFDNVLLSYKRLARYEKRMLSKCDAFIVVVNEAQLRLNTLNPFKKGVIVSNTKNPGTITFIDIPKKDKIQLVYVGTIQDLRGLDTAVKAMLHLPEDKYELTIVGFKEGCFVKKSLQAIIDLNHLTNVNLIDFIRDELQLDQYISNAHIGIIPHANCELCKTTVPHKLFTYMAMGRPVLVSDVKPLKRLVENKLCGAVFKAGSEEDFAKQIKYMSDYNLLVKMGIKARELVETEYNWAADAKRLIDIYDELLN